MHVNFIIGLIIIILIFLAIYFLQGKSRGVVPAQETGKKVQSEAAKPGESATRPDEHVDPFKSAVPPKE